MPPSRVELQTARRQKMQIPIQFDVQSKKLREPLTNQPLELKHQLRFSGSI